MDVKKRSSDPAVQELLKKAAEAGMETAWDRLEAQEPQCGFGQLGLCCRVCNMGPCRIDPFGEGPQRGVCGADCETIIARNFLRAVAAGASAHSDHGRGVAHAFLAMAKGEAPDYGIKDRTKLLAMAREWGIKTEGRADKEIAQELGELALAEFGKPHGYQRMVARAPAPRQAIWKKYDITPRSFDREVVEALHRTTMGVDQDYKSIIRHASRTGLADGWGGSMIATELQDIMFGTPTPTRGEINLGVLREDSVNLVVHGHEPLLSEMVAAASTMPEIVAEAKAAGAQGVNVAGICCTANELLVRHGIPVAGNFLSQELAISTGAVDLMCVDIQCIMQGLTEAVRCYHTKLITTSEKAHLEGVEHVQMDEGRALEVGKEICRKAIAAYKTRRGPVSIPQDKGEAVVGFSHEAIKYMLGGHFRASYRPLNDNIINGRIRGVVGVVGCTNPKVTQDLGPHDPRQGTHQARCAGRDDRVRPDRLRQGGPPDARGGRVRGAGPPRDLRDGGHSAGAGRRVVRRQQPHPGGLRRDGPRGRPGRGPLRPARGRGVPGTHHREGPLHRPVLRGLRRPGGLCQETVPDHAGNEGLQVPDRRDRRRGGRQVGRRGRCGQGGRPDPRAHRGQARRPRHQQEPGTQTVQHGRSPKTTGVNSFTVSRPS